MKEMKNEENKNGQGLRRACEKTKKQDKACKGKKEKLGKAKNIKVTWREQEKLLRTASQARAEKERK
ncbi:hypothetical protein HMPREF1633_04720 [Tissierellia bacterium S5-A11]|nr:hypothetical protein HMPREF1633_04720 [Tissierellia bacterium S5-A11]